jgi:CRISPR/Cas system CMR-associated protein Cmr5 small subunit
MYLINFIKKHIKKTFVIIFFNSLIPNFFFYKSEAYYNKNANQANLKNFSYQTTSLGELSNHFKTIIIKNNDFYVKKGVNSMVNIAEITYGLNVYSETKTELDLYHKFNFFPKNFEDKKINFWSKNKIINNIYLR